MIMEAGRAPGGQRVGLRHYCPMDMRESGSQQDATRTQPVYPDAPTLYGIPPTRTSQIYGGPAGPVPLAQRRWLLPAALAVLVAGLLAGGIMAAFGLTSGGGSHTPRPAAAPLPGELGKPTAPASAAPTGQPTDQPTSPPTPHAASLANPPVRNLYTASRR